tara:strand:+ start:2846 stop:3184 length:339 start_codon:yes stop_codon:yes gene_type:complete
MDELKLNIAVEEKKEILPGLTHSNSVNMKILEHRFKVQEERYKDTWKSCCIVLDRRAVQYFTQIVIMASCMGFSILQLSRLHDCTSQQTYIGLLTLLIGIMLPNPKFNGGND